MSIVGTLIPWIEQRFFLTSGLPNSGGRVYTYQTDGTTPKETYTDVDGATPHANPILLNAHGRPSSPIFLGDGGYTFIVTDASVVPLYTVSNIGGGASAGAGLVATQTRYVTQTPVGNIDGGEDTLASYIFPASQLRADGDAVRITAFGVWANNANVKRLRMRFGSTTLFDTGGALTPGANGLGWHLTATIVRVGAAQQTACVVAIMKLGSADTWTTVTAASETLANALSVVLTGEATTTDDIVLKSFRIVYEPASV